MKHGDFSQLAEDYSKYRPGYSPFVLEGLMSLARTKDGKQSIADVGAGTGIWTRHMLPSGFEITAVEPNEAMRKLGIIKTEKDRDGIRWVAGSAEATNLPDSSCDIVTMASSFHWADFDVAIKEFNRILRPGGVFMSLWNTRYIESNPVLINIEEELRRLLPDMKRVSSGRSEFCDSLFEKLKGRSEFEDVMYLEGRHSEQQSLDRYIGLWRSVNDVRVQAGPERFEQFIEYIKTILADVEYINADYMTRAWIARKRELAMSGGVIWITGLSGAGKTTTAKALTERFHVAGREPVIIDGDQIREAVGDASCGHNLDDRLSNAYRICRFAELVASQGRIVIVATMSLFHEIHSWNRDNFPCYLEVLLDVSLDTLTSNDSKGLYANGKDLPGIDLTPQFPVSPHLLIENQGFATNPEAIAEDIHRLFLEVYGSG